MISPAAPAKPLDIETPSIDDLIGALVDAYKEGCGKCETCSCRKGFNKGSGVRASQKTGNDSAPAQINE